MKETKAFATSVMLSLVSKRGFGDKFGAIHEAAEWIAGHPIWTHEFAMKEVWDELGTRIVAVHPEFASAQNDLPKVTPENAADIIRGYSKSMWEMPEGDGKRMMGPLETLKEVAPNATVVVLDEGGAP